MTTQFKDVRGIRVVNGVGTKIDTSEVTTPTKSELEGAFGAANKTTGMLFIQDDNGANTTVKLVLSNGTDYYFVALTKAT
jgi:hypothetical protein